ncbi:MAG: hypothetical protein EOQ69_22785 [Mesorhizobium sp.]|nr:MAG: hypothetical protein EOQ69_22785 [Mesorhizobium sp.]
MTSDIRANPVYTAKDYPLIRKLSDDDMPATWEEWRSAFEKLEAENRQQHSIACRVRVHAGKIQGMAGPIHFRDRNVRDSAMLKSD